MSRRTTATPRRFLATGIGTLLCFALAWLLLPGAAALAQIEQEDLDETSVIPPEIEQLFAEAEAKFATVDQPDTVATFGQIASALEPLAQSGHAAATSLLLRSLSYRAQAEFNFGDGNAAEADIRRMLGVDPSYDIDRQAVSRRFAELYDRVRQRTIGTVQATLVPPDATLAIGSHAYGSPSHPIYVAAGEHSASITRPGYAPQSVPLVVAAGETTALDVTLERTHAVLRIRTRPNEASLFVDGELRGETRGQAEQGFVPGGDAASFRPEEFSQQFYLEVAPGQYLIEVRKPGFRPWRQSVRVAELADYDLGVVMLEREAGTVLLTQLPTDAELRLDGRVVRPTRDGAGAARLVLSPGAYRLSVTRGTAERYERAIDLADGEEIALAVELRPSVTLLGVLGGDREAARKLQRDLVAAIEPIGAWSVLDRQAEAAPLLERLGLDAARLRSLSPSLASATAPPQPVDWGAVQAATDRELPGALYVLGVVSDDLLARSAELWIWPAAPGPSQPERRTVDLENAGSIAALANGFRPTFLRPRPVLGVLWMDSLAAAGPVAAHVAPSSPASAAGLALGDVLLSIAGTPVFSTQQLAEQLLKLEPGESAALEVRRGGGAQTVQVEVGRSWELVPLEDPRLVYPALSAAVEAELSRAGEFPRWMLQLNRAAMQIVAGDGEGAVRTLREVDAAIVPVAGGISRATLDYLLGLALLEAGPRYGELAREAFERAAADPEARLQHADGPLVRPRARVRIEQLTATQP